MLSMNHFLNQESLPLASIASTTHHHHKDGWRRKVQSQKTCGIKEAAHSPLSALSIFFLYSSQRDSTGLTSHNSELKFRLQAMEQQAQLRDALNKALTAGVQRLKLASAELSGDPSKFQQLSINSQQSQQFQLCQQQATRQNIQQQMAILLQ
ncbi:unnamed protein product [Fraxinus pennsylvanica]|uniref:Uncharacterized protein n=1 Tax=Fraxinus pennsylvanica TaxID=56036 RepID=A0AAD1ZVV2_9LAMI|nr:unnamed protein product [Fraxinus pennsylvanica]